MAEPGAFFDDLNGNWVNVKTFGMPAGDLKRMVVDLSNLFLSSDHRIRLHLRVRKTTIWVIDRIRLDDSAPVPVTTQEVAASSADLQAGRLLSQCRPRSTGFMWGTTFRSSQIGMDTETSQGMAT